MRFWWVNQNQTFRQEISGGYLWSPKRKANQRKNPFYETMREVAPGDLVFSFEGTFIRALGTVRSYCYECPKPPEFGAAGPNWNVVGWRVEVSWRVLIHQIRPMDYLNVIIPALPGKYSPLRENGYGNQGVYLAEVRERLVKAIGGLIGPEFSGIVAKLENAPDPKTHMLPTLPSVEDWEAHIQQEIEDDAHLKQTERTALIQARRGQGTFKKNVFRIEGYCRITKVDNPAHLIASHCKPWRDSDNDERLNGENGLLLTPTIDHLFDRGFISFDNDGQLLISPVAHRLSLSRMGINTDEPVNVGGFSSGQKNYLDFHRSSVFLQRQ